MGSDGGVGELDYVLPAVCHRLVEEVVRGRRCGRGERGTARAVGGHDRRGGSPHGVEARSPQLAGQEWKHVAHRVGGGGCVHQHGGIPVGVGCVEPQRGVDQSIDHGWDVLGVRRVQLGGLLTPAGGLVELRDPGSDAELLHRHCRDDRDRLLGLQNTGQRYDGHRQPAGGPVRQAVRELVDAWLRLDLPECLDSMTDPDDPVGCAGRDARQKPRPPLHEHLAPRTLRDLAAEEVDPVTGADRITQVLPPRLRLDRRDATGPLVQPGQVAVDPAVDAVGPALVGQHLDHHRPVVGQPAGKLRAGRVEALEGFVVRRRL